MGDIVYFTARLIRAGRRAYERKWSFLGVFTFVFISGVVFLGEFGLLPETVVANAAPNVTLAARPSLNVSELPTRIEIPKIGLAATIANPTTTVIEALDRQLLKGAVRYPTSAKLGETGNVVLFGHSSYLPVVGNQAYKTFNGIQKLMAGDTVTVYSAGAAYTYRVRSVAKESASDAEIELSVTGRVLTLATCNSFGAKTDRFIVVADFVESHSISI